MVRRILFLMTLASVFAASANAQIGGPTSRARRWDFTVQTRYVGEQSIAGEYGSEASIEDDLGWGFGFGYNVNERLNLGFVISWRSAAYTATVIPELDPDDLQSYSNWLETSTFAVTGEFNILPKRFTPYVSGGLGWTLLDTNVPADLYTGCYYDPWYGYVCYSDVATYGTDGFAYSVGAGVRLEVTETIFFRVGYEYNDVDVEGAEGVNIFRLDFGISMR